MLCDVGRWCRDVHVVVVAACLCLGEEGREGERGAVEAECVMVRVGGWGGYVEGRCGGGVGVVCVVWFVLLRGGENAVYREVLAQVRLPLQLLAPPDQLLQVLLLPLQLQQLLLLLLLAALLLRSLQQQRSKQVLFHSGAFFASLWVSGWCERERKGEEKRNPSNWRRCVVGL